MGRLKAPCTNRTVSHFHYHYEWDSGPGWPQSLCATLGPMGARFAVLPVLAVLAALILSGAPPQAPPGMFSPWYAESLRDVLAFEEADAARFERMLAANPDDFPARLKLMGLSSARGSGRSCGGRTKRFQHAEAGGRYCVPSITQPRCWCFEVTAKRTPIASLPPCF